MKNFFVIIFIIILIAIGVFLYIKNTNLSPEDFEEEQEQNLLDRQEVINDVVEKISQISPVEPVLGGNWYVTRFWFIKDSNKDFYVEYEDGHILRQVLATAEKKDNNLKYKVIGYFEPGETTWALKRGEDSFLGEGLELYERDRESGRWVKMN